MTVLCHNDLIPDYRGLEWLSGNLPTEGAPWPSPSEYSRIYCSGDEFEAMEEDIHDYAGTKFWLWPDRPQYFFTDMHADTDAFLRSLVASGGIEKTGPEDSNMVLTESGHKAEFVFGGDCFDKGPHNLRLFRAIGALRDTGANVSLLVGNHDLRTYIGLVCAGRKDTRHAHLFVRMGKKAVPLFKEIFDAYLAGGDRQEAASDDEVREAIFPDKSWYEEFPEAVAGLIPPARIEKELRRIREKTVEFQARCNMVGLSLGDVYSALKKARQLFLHPDGEFGWYFQDLKLAYKAGSFLMVHGGVDNHVAAILRSGGVDALNEAFSLAMKEDLFELYNGPLGNVFRTKYRPNDFPFTDQGLKNIHAAGVYAILHGHRNLLRGQQITLRNGLLNFECDATVNAGSRADEGLDGVGGAVTVIHPDSHILGISTDYPLVKVFDPAHVCGLTTVVPV